MGTPEAQPVKELSMRTDDVAQRIEYATHSKWTPAEYATVCGMLRLYRHHSIETVLNRAARDEDSGLGEAKDA